jgi:uncharacterized membrane protein YhaH (DUF805 family)
MLCSVPGTYGAAGAYPHGEIVFLLSIIPTLWMVFAIYTKRFHDIDKSAWWLFALLIPGFPLVLGLLPGTEGNNRFGAAPLQSRVALS